MTTRERGPRALAGVLRKVTRPIFGKRGFAGGAVVTETIYAWPGLGKLAIDSVLNQDIPLMLGAVLAASPAIVLANLVVDLLYAWLDPRIRLG